MPTYSSQYSTGKLRVASLLLTVIFCEAVLLAGASAQVSKAEAQAHREGYYWTSSGWMRAGDSRAYHWVFGKWVPIESNQSAAQLQSARWEQRTFPQQGQRVLSQYEQQLARAEQAEKEAMYFTRLLAEERKRTQAESDIQDKYERDAVRLYPWASQGDLRNQYIQWRIEAADALTQAKLRGRP